MGLGRGGEYPRIVDAALTTRSRFFAIEASSGPFLLPPADNVPDTIRRVRVGEVERTAYLSPGLTLSFGNAAAASGVAVFFAGVARVESSSGRLLAEPVAISPRGDTDPALLAAPRPAE